ncbi:antigen WC1.1-like [Heterocephalus glaber]|uniref:Antigen WC1.1-like n=1 Tax=Heterocephalus glaber TaxID=10181 RepID=A0AAX6SHJ7_HETGA|nr:antigen WC1.1-like [Heterocephalus glaber]
MCSGVSCDPLSVQLIQFTEAIFFLFSLAERMTVPSTSTSTSSVPAPIPGVFSLPGILCIILGTLLFMVLIILGMQLHRGRAQLKASPNFEDSVEEALYQEIDYLLNLEEDPVDRSENLSDDSANMLPYYTGDSEESGDPESAPGQHIDATGNGYDDVEELPAPEIPFTSGMSDKSDSPQEESGARCLQGGISLDSPREASNTSMEEKGSPLVLGQEDAGYDDIELSPMECHF